MYYIGIDLGGTNIAAGIVTESGEVIHRGSTPTMLERGAEPICEDIGKLCLRLIEEKGLTLDDIGGIGAGVPGIANNDTGVIYFCTNLKWHNVPIREYLMPYINKPLYIENDATVAGLAESVIGVTKGAKQSVFLTLGTGVGGGLINDGVVYSGHHHIGSELGHMIVEVDGDQCTCGNKGCWERYASASALIRWGKEALAANPDSAMMKAVEGNPDKVTAKVVIDAAKEGDPAACQVYDRYIKYLTAGLVTIINFYDPEIIALGGGVSLAGEFLLNSVRECLRKHIFYKDIPYARVELSTLGNDAGIVGAAMLGRDNASR